MRSQINTTRYEDITFTHNQESERVQIDKEIEIGGEWFHSLERGEEIQSSTIERNNNESADPNSLRIQSIAEQAPWMSEEHIKKL